jgi:trk system potassium uptake protein TrkA
MRAVIVGAGRTGSFVAADLAGAGHNVIVLDENDVALSALEGITNLDVLRADGCDPEKLEEAGVGKADIVIAVTGQDEDNLVVSWLSKYVFGVKRVVARVNNPKNSWLYSEEWGVDAPVSAAKIIGTLIEEEVRFADLVTIAKLREGAVSLVEIVVSAAGPAAGRRIEEIELPQGAKLIVVMRDHQLADPEPSLLLTENDTVLALTTDEAEAALLECFAPPAE